MTATRKGRIHAGLEDCEARGIIRSYYAQGGMPGLRWVLEGVGFHTRVYTTNEVEAFLLGASEGTARMLRMASETWYLAPLGPLALTKEGAQSATNRAPA